MAITEYSVFNVNSDQSSINWNELLSIIYKAFEASNLALLVGSGVSQFVPANVPAGEKIVKHLMTLMLSTYPEELQDLPKKIEYSTDGIPFEVLMARMSELNADLAQKIVVILTRIKVDHSNTIHQQIRRLIDVAADQDLALPVITSNYDMGISHVHENKDFSSIIRSMPDIVITEDQLNEFSAREIFHIHGANTSPISLVFDYKQEFKLEQWKRKHLQSIMQNKLVLILGFSGKDLDICRALVDCKLQGVIWFRTSEESCKPDNWTLDAQNLAKKVPLSYSVNTHGELQYALAELLHDDLATLPRVKVDETAIQSRFKEIEQTYPVQLRLWARWMGLRAGFWRLADGLTEGECDLLSEQQILEIKAFGYYYSGRHLSGARLLHEAGRKAIRANKPAEQIGQYLYLCNTEVEYLNRGAYTLWAILAALRVSFVVLWRTLVYRDRMTQEAWDEYKNLLGSLATIWPLFPMLLSSNMLGTWPVAPRRRRRFG